MMSSNSLMPLDLNEEDQSHQASSSSSSLPYPILFNPHHNHEQSLTDHDEAEKIEIPCGGSCINSKKENRSETNDEADDHQDDGSMKWMCSKSKTRMMRKMMVPELEQAAAPNSTPKFEEDDHIHEKQPAPSDNSSNTTSCSNHNHIISVRVCADCHTTKTPLWRSGPTGPKSLCNACGIRQRKARRAMAAAANGAGVAAKAGVVVKGNKLQNKQKKQELKKKGKVMGKKKFGFEDLALSLSNNLGLQQVFPQDEKEAAILLMALSYGLVHG